MKIKNILKSITAASSLAVAVVPLASCSSPKTEKQNNQTKEQETTRESKGEKEVDERGGVDKLNLPEPQLNSVTNSKYCKLSFVSSDSTKPLVGQTTVTVRAGKTFSTVKKPTLDTEGYEISKWTYEWYEGTTKKTGDANDAWAIPGVATCKITAVVEEVGVNYNLTLFAGANAKFPVSPKQEGTESKCIVTLQMNSKKTIQESINETYGCAMFPESNDLTETFDGWKTTDSTGAEVDANFAQKPTSDLAFYASYNSTDFAPRLESYPSAVGIKVLEAGSLYLTNKGTNAPNLEYSTDGSTWTDVPTDSSSAVTLTADSNVYLKGNNSGGFSTSTNNYSNIKLTGKCTLNGSVMGLLYDGAASTTEQPQTTIPCNYCFYCLFNWATGTNKISSNLLLATNLNTGCYDDMFSYCTGLTSLPSGLLPATTLATACYSSMFWGCTALATLPSGLLPSITLTSSCYEFMFYKCTGLTTLPENLLPASKLVSNCYKAMFENCTSLKTAPDLVFPENLPYCCYNAMFENCSSLTKVNNHEINENWFLDMGFWNGNHSFGEYWCQGMFGGDLDNEGNPLGPYDIYLKNSGKSCPFTLPDPYDEETGKGYQLQPYCFSGLNVACQMTTIIDENYLPWTTLAPYCYSNMFGWNKCIKSLPENLLPAETLKNNCYEGMFKYCSSLKISEGDPSKITQGIIFNCPSEIPTNAVKDMFLSCSSGGAFRGTPTAGKTYYWYTE